MLKPLKPAHKLNLQLFAGGIFDGVEVTTENPILSDAFDDVGSRGSDETIPADTEGTQAIENPSPEAPPASPTVQTKEPTIDFGEIKNKLDTILGKMDKSPEEMQKVEEMTEELTEDDIERMNNDFYLKFTEKPLEALEKLIEERAEKKIAPVMEYFEGIKKQEYWNGILQEFEKEHPDFPEYVQDISKIIQSDESIRNSNKPIELAYKVAKADKFESKVRPLDQQLKDSGVLKELLQNKDIKNLIVKELKSGGIETPKVIGSEGNTTINVSEKPKTLSDATKAWLNI